MTSLFFRPDDNEVQSLQDKLNLANPKNWSVKNAFSLLALVRDMQTPGDLAAALEIYSLDFVAFLIAGDGCPIGATRLGALRQMVDGGIDADRLDYVYRDASVTIGSLSRPTTVLESIASYTSDHVVVSDPRLVVDFLSTRMRLWTFVYSAPDVRFRQALLKTFLQGRLDSPKTPAQFSACRIDPELGYDEFLDLDDHSLMSRIHACRKKAAKTLQSFRKVAAELLLGADFSLVGTLRGAWTNESASLLFGHALEIIGHVEAGSGVWLESEVRVPLNFRGWNYFAGHQPTKSCRAELGRLNVGLGAFLNETTYIPVCARMRVRHLRLCSAWAQPPTNWSTGAIEETRTPDLTITNRLLYRLSYGQEPRQEKKD